MKLSLMTSNIWADVFGNPVRGRDRALLSIVSRYRPDILMLQEVHPHWHECDVMKIGLPALGYTVSTPDLGGNPLNYTPLLYNSGRFEELRSMFRLYSGPNDYLSKSISGAVLRDKASGERFAALSTHMYYAKNDKGNSVRIKSAAELAEFIRILTGGVMPAFCGGDFNCKVSSDPFEILTANHIECASLFAEERIDFIRTNHKNPQYDAAADRYIAALPSEHENKKSIDHIVFCGNTVRIRSYRVITDEAAMILSDHCPVLITAEC